MQTFGVRREPSPFDQLYRNPHLEGGVSRWCVKGRQKVRHLDVVEFDLPAYRERPAVPGEVTEPVRCYAVYSPMNKNVLLYTYPGYTPSFTDNLTKERARHCRVLGSVYNDDQLYQELRALLNA